MRIQGNKPAMFAVIVIVLAGLICTGFLLYQGLNSAGGNGTQIEQEDCDAEDFRNREADCGFTQPRTVKTTKPAAPKPKTTRK